MHGDPGDLYPQWLRQEKYNKQAVWMLLSSKALISLGRYRKAGWDVGRDLHKHHPGTSSGSSLSTLFLASTCQLAPPSTNKYLPGISYLLEVAGVPELPHQLLERGERHIILQLSVGLCRFWNSIWIRWYHNWIGSKPFCTETLKDCHDLQKRLCSPLESWPRGWRILSYKITFKNEERI